MQVATSSPIRWAGSKKRALAKISRLLAIDHHRYIEPFVGSASIFFAVQPNNATLSDINPDLINALVHVRSEPENLYHQITKFDRLLEYHFVRSIQPELLSPLEQAARFFYLNRRCFNGIYRTNRLGHFNVPPGSRCGQILSLPLLIACGKALQTADIICKSFESVIALANSQDLLILDPPYFPRPDKKLDLYGHEFLSATQEQLLLQLTVEAANRGAHIIFFYPESKVILLQLPGFSSTVLTQTSTISAKPGGRRPLGEAIYSNIPISSA